MSFNREPLTAEEQAALDIIRKHRAIISMHFDITYPDDDPGTDNPIYDHADTDSLVNQLYDPNKFRPSLTEQLFASNGLQRPAKLKKLNMKTGDVFEYTPGECRNTKHKNVEFQHTAKTATSLLPPEPEYMKVIGYDLIGYLWDIDACDLKDERYVWETDGASDLCYWISPNPNNPQPEDIMPIAPISKLRENNLEAIKAKETTWWNELDIGLPKRRIDAMFASQDTLLSRLRVWNQMLRDKKRLEFLKDIPIFIIQSDHQDGRGAVFRVYGSNERTEDLTSAITLLQNPPSDMEAKTVTIMRAVVSELTIALKPSESNNASMHAALVKQKVNTEVDQLRNALESGKTKLEEEINSWWIYPNKDRKRVKLDAHDKIISLLNNPKELLRYIAALENQQSPVLQGFFSTRTLNLITKTKQWAETEKQKKDSESAPRLRSHGS